MTVIVVAHTGHEKKSRARGSYDIYASSDFEILLKKFSDDMTIEVSSTKEKDCKKSDPFYFSTVQVEVTDGIGEVSSTLVVVPKDAPATGFEDFPQKTVEKTVQLATYGPHRVSDSDRKVLLFMAKDGVKDGLPNLEKVFTKHEIREGAKVFSTTLTECLARLVKRTWLHSGKHDQYTMAGDGTKCALMLQARAKDG